jgi:hypothetical protein
MARDPKIVLSVIMTVLMLSAWLSRNWWAYRLPKQWVGLLFGALLTSRVVFLILAVLLGGRVSDNASVLWSVVERMQSGLTPFRDFGSPIETPYNPPFYYSLIFLGDEIQLSLFLSLLEVGSFIALFYLFESALTEYQLRLWSVLYLLSPLSLWWGGIGGHTHAPIVMASALVVLLFRAKHLRFSDFLGGLIAGLSFSLTKLTFLTPLPLTLSFSRRITQTVIGFIIGLLIFIPVYTALWSQYSAFVLSAASNSVGPSTWIILNTVTNGVIPRTSTLYSPLSLLVCWLIGLWVFARQHSFKRQRSERESTYIFITGWCMIWGAFSLITPVGQSSYFMYWLGPALALLCLSPKNRVLLSAILVLNLVANVQGSLYYANSGLDYRDLANPTARTLVVLDIVILGSYAVIGLRAWLLFRTVGSEPINPRSGWSEETITATEYP